MSNEKKVEGGRQRRRKREKKNYRAGKGVRKKN